MVNKYAEYNLLTSKKISDLLIKITVYGTSSNSKLSGPCCVYHLLSQNILPFSLRSSHLHFAHWAVQEVP